GEIHYSQSSAPVTPTMGLLSQPRNRCFLAHSKSYSVAKKGVRCESQDPGLYVLSRGGRRGVRGHRSCRRRPRKCYQRSCDEFDGALHRGSAHRSPQGAGRCEGEGCREGEGRRQGEGCCEGQGRGQGEGCCESKGSRQGSREVPGRQGREGEGREGSRSQGSEIRRRQGRSAEGSRSRKGL